MINKGPGNACCWVSAKSPHSHTLQDSLGQWFSEWGPPPATSVASENSLEKQTLKFRRSTESAALRVGPGHLCLELSGRVPCLRTMTQGQVSADGLTLDMTECSSCCCVRFLVTHGTRPRHCSKNAIE